MSSTRPAPPPPARRIDPDLVAGVLMTLLTVAVAVPVALLQASGDDPTLGPPWLWWAAYGLFLVTNVAVTWGLELLTRQWLRALFAVQVGAGWSVVLLAPYGAGFVPILLVFTAAMSAYVVSRRATYAIVVINTVVIAVTGQVGAWGPAEAWLTAGLYVLIQAVAVASVGSHQREERSRRELAEAHTELRATTALLADRSKQAERVRIARDLHDVLGHQLTALTLELEVASHHAQGPGQEHVGRARGIAKDLLADVRGAVGDLREQPVSLREALEAMACDLPRPEVHVAVDDGLELDDHRAIALVRCAQEIVTNAIRHTDARNLWLTVTADPAGVVTLTGRDDGVGTRDLVLGNGLRGLRERVEQFGGSAIFRSASGFEVVAQVPST